MNVLLFGASGFVGSFFKVHYLRLGYIVTGVDLISDTYVHPSYSFFRGDLTSLQFFDEIMTNSRFDFLVNCAARTDLSGSSVDDYSANFIIPQFISEYFQVRPSPGVKVIHFSSMLRNASIGSISYFYGKSKDIGDKYFLNNENSFTSYVIELPSVWGPFMKSPYLNFFRLVKSRLFFYNRYFSGLKSFLYVGNLFELVSICFFSNLATTRIVAKDYDISSNEFAKLISSSIGIKLFSLPGFFVYLLSKLGDFLSLFSISFPINTFRLRNMSMGRIVQPTCIDPKLYSLTPLNSAIAHTLQHFNFSNLDE